MLPSRLQLLGMWWRGSQRTSSTKKAIPLQRKEIHFAIDGTLRSLLIYFMSLFVIPKLVAPRLENSKGYPIERRGSREKAPSNEIVVNLSILNKALLGKWCWRGICFGERS